jgi:hypothetical protein
MPSRDCRRLVLNEPLWPSGGAGLTRFGMSSQFGFPELRNALVWIVPKIFTGIFDVDSTFTTDSSATCA